MNSLILNPLPPLYLGTPFWGVGVGGGILCLLRFLCVYSDLGPENFSCIWTPYPMVGLPGPNSVYSQSPPPPPHMAPCQ